ncbi:MAG: lysophospholipid acyltransferase family protein [Actinomycetota bacterium]|nr:lysophospholipid acyltransferase family protein [Actinomycetota bacterium]
MRPALPRRLAAVLSPPTWPGAIERPAPKARLGTSYDTSWARTPAARVGRAVMLDNLTRPLVHLVAAPEVSGLEHLEPLERPVIFAGNHASHLDTSILLSCLPARFRHKSVVAAASDYFFDRHWKAALWSFSLGTIPIERTKVERRSLELIAGLLDDGWSLVIFPEGGRSPDGWGQEFRGWAAYLAKRCGVPVVPFHLRGTRPILAKGSSSLRPGKVEVRFGDALRLEPAGPERREEDARRFGARIEAAVSLLADEAESDWWSARRRASEGATPPLRGPQAAPWRRTWALPDSARKDGARRRLGPAQPW